jgi:hypothetical protein
VFTPIVVPLVMEVEGLSGVGFGARADPGSVVFGLLIESSLTRTSF